MAYFCQHGGPNLIRGSLELYAGYGGLEQDE